MRGPRGRARGVERRAACADPLDPDRTLRFTRELGLVVARGTAVMTLTPEDGLEEIDNPFEEVADAE